MAATPIPTEASPEPPCGYGSHSLSLWPDLEIHPQTAEGPGYSSADVVRLGDDD